LRRDGDGRIALVYLCAAQYAEGFGQGQIEGHDGGPLQPPARAVQLVEF
jgi:hypothetical protein